MLVPIKKATKSSWINNKTLNRAEDKRRVKQIKHLSPDHLRTYEKLCSEVKRSAKKQRKLNTTELCRYRPTITSWKQQGSVRTVEHVKQEPPIKIKSYKESRWKDSSLKEKYATAMDTRL